MVPVFSGSVSIMLCLDGGIGQLGTYVCGDCVFGAGLGRNLLRQGHVSGSSRLALARACKGGSLLPKRNSLLETRSVCLAQVLDMEVGHGNRFVSPACARGGCIPEYRFHPFWGDGSWSAEGLQGLMKFGKSSVLRPSCRARRIWVNINNLGGLFQDWRGVEQRGGLRICLWSCLEHGEPKTNHPHRSKYYRACGVSSPLSYDQMHLGSALSVRPGWTFAPDSTMPSKGLCQGLLSGVVLPGCANRLAVVGEVRKLGLVNAASIISNLLIPGSSYATTERDFPSCQKGLSPKPWLNPEDEPIPPHPPHEEARKSLIWFFQPLQWIFSSTIVCADRSGEDRL